jgi:TetR/AcrR family transcriptional regulator, mexJK operon transcriptional repressor
MSSFETTSDERQSARKRRAILEAATTAFLHKGYLGTSMDEVAALASVSKQTVYKHFAGKEKLFAEMVAETVDEVSDPVHAAALEFDETGDIEVGLRDLARRQLAMVMQPRLLRLRRLVIGEAARFPELGRAFSERGPERTIDTLAPVFERLAKQGVLDVDDARLAAAHFNWLVMSVPLNQAMLRGTDEPASPEELNRYADAGVRVFVRAYGSR